MALIRILPRICAVLLLLTACSSPPGLEAGARITPTDQPVVLLPLDELLVQANRGVSDDTSAAALVARAARLRAATARN